MNTQDKAQHTPGPWRLRHNGIHDGDRTVTSNTRDIADLDGGCNDDTEIYANARLIAAAPELLAALTELLADRYLADPINADRMKNARAAVAKAKGGEQ